MLCCVTKYAPSKQHNNICLFWFGLMPNAPNWASNCKSHWLKLTSSSPLNFFMDGILVIMICWMGAADCPSFSVSLYCLGRTSNRCFFYCVWGNGVIRVQKIITTSYKKSMNKYHFQIITRFPYKPPRRNTRPSDITASSQLKINLVTSILSLIYTS